MLLSDNGIPHGEAAGLRYEEITELIWDDDGAQDGNVAHLRKHNVHPWEVRQALLRATVFTEVGAEGASRVYRAVGPTANHRRPRLLEVWGMHYQAPPAHRRVAHHYGV